MVLVLSRLISFDRDVKAVRTYQLPFPNSTFSPRCIFEFEWEEFPERPLSAEKQDFGNLVWGSDSEYIKVTHIACLSG